MVQRRSLTPPAGRGLTEVIREVVDPAAGATRPFGTADMGTSGDLTWTELSVKHSLRDDINATLAGVADTGWVAHGATLASGVTVVLPIVYRKIGTVVYWRGQCYKASGWTLDTDNVILSNIPAALRPIVAIPLACSAIGVYTAIMQPDGRLTTYPQFETGGWPLFAGSYPVG